MRRVKIGIIGTGFMAEAHASCFKLDHRVEISSICSREEENCAIFAEKYNCSSCTTNWQELVRDNNIDLVDITAPNYLHADMAIAAAEQGKAVIVEKPLALTVEEGQKVVDTVQKQKVSGFYAENRLFAPIFSKAREMIERGEIGKPLILRINEMGSGPGHGGWFWDREKAGGGALIDMGIHGLCLSEWLIDSPIVSVQAAADTLKWKDRCVLSEDTVMTTARFKNGTLGQFICSWAIEGGLDIRAEVFGSSGTIYLDQSRTINGVYAYRLGSPDVLINNRPHVASNTGWFYPLVDEWNVRGHSFELRHFIDCFIDGTESVSGMKRGLRALKLVHAIYDSAEKRIEVAIPE